MRIPFRPLSVPCLAALLAAVFTFPIQAAAAGSAPAAPATAAADPLAWPELKREHKPWTRWWWMGSAVDKENLTRELESFAAAGLGGVEITPIYGAKGYEDRFIDFLSPKYMEMLAHTTSEAKRLGLAVDMATGTGWPFGGSFTPQEDAELKIEIKDGKFAPRPTGFKVKRAASGAAGLVLDPYSPEAIKRYLAHFDKAFASLPTGAIHGHFHDSFEYTANWTPALLEKFKSMHGYDLADHIDALTGNADPDTTARIKSDYREVLAELHMAYMHAWGDWVRSHGGVVRNQGHGAPANLLDLYALADVPETEVFGATNFPIPGYRFTPGEISYNETQPLINRFASSAAHVTGKPLISSETFTWAREHFHEAPSELKPELDQLFLTGINHVFYHGTAYSPADAPWPGWLFYASTQYNDRNPLWRDLADGLNAYITRAQSLLQSGQPDADVLVYWPYHDLLHQAEGWERKFTMHGKEWLTESSTGKLAQQLIEAGIQFDFVSDTQIQATTVNNRVFKTSPDTAYRLIVIPSATYMPVETLKHLIDLVEEGAAIFFQGELPKDVPGLANLQTSRARFVQELARIQPTERLEHGSVARIGKGIVIIGTATNEVLESSAAFRETAADQGLRILRRRYGNKDNPFANERLYFISNLGDKPFNGFIDLPTANRSVSLFDARTGQTGIAEKIFSFRDPVPSKKATPSTSATVHSSNARPLMHVRLQLAPGESIFVRTFAKEDITGPAWKYLDPIGEPQPLTGDWRVTFLHGGPELPPAFSIPNAKLTSWTEQSPAHEAFAGTARYEIDFEMPPSPVHTRDWLLDLGDVRETARVFVNGTEVGLLWSLPFRTRIEAKHLKAGRNTLVLEVTNLAANRIRDLDKRGVKWANFYDANVVNVNYKKMDAAAWPIMPAGLLGPITLTPLK